ncbi:hypothetical protein ScPMuIL_002349 [Solemya velum]
MASIDRFVRCVSSQLKQRVRIKIDLKTIHEDGLTMMTISVCRFSQERNVQTITYSKSQLVSNLIAQVCSTLGIPQLSNQADLYNKCYKLNQYLTVQAEIGHEFDSADLKLVVRQTQRQLCVQQSTANDMINPWDTNPRVLMPCGHGITPDNLYDYCWDRLQQRKTQFKCPHVGTGFARCDRVWDYNFVVRAACLSADEKCLFDWVCNNNFQKDVGLNINTPQSKAELNNVLQNCPRKNIIGVNGCPSKRACPKCQFLLEHGGAGNCKHMDCPNCEAKFCFICLQMKTDPLYWPDSCGGAFIICTIAPIQSF